MHTSADYGSVLLEIGQFTLSRLEKVKKNDDGIAYLVWRNEGTYRPIPMARVRSVSDICKVC